MKITVIQVNNNILGIQNRLKYIEEQIKNIDETDFEILNKAGCFKGIEYEKDRDRYYVNNLKDCAKLIMNFIALSMPEDFTYKLTESEIEPINGDWNGELNVQFGYGLFFD